MLTELTMRITQDWTPLAPLPAPCAQCVKRWQVASHATCPRFISRARDTPSIPTLVSVASSNSSGDTQLTRHPRWSSTSASPSVTSAG